MSDRECRSSAIENASPQCFRDFGGRRVVAASGQFPFRAIGHVVVELGDGRRHKGGGTLLSDFTVLTAGHLVKTVDNAFMDIAKMYFIPAAHHLTRPYGIYDWNTVRAVNSGGRDWGLISLTEPAGHSVGYLGAYAQRGTDEWIGQAGLSCFAQPKELHDEMWVDEDVQILPGDHPERLYTDQRTTSFQAGAPLVRNWHSNNPQVIAALVSDDGRGVRTNEFMPGMHSDTGAGWLTWLCEEFVHLNRCDRLKYNRTATTLETVAMQPDYSPYSFTADDDGPTVRYWAANSRVQNLRACLIDQ